MENTIVADHITSMVARHVPREIVRQLDIKAKPTNTPFVMDVTVRHRTGPLFVGTVNMNNSTINKAIEEIIGKAKQL